MSYEQRMLVASNMPKREDVEIALLKTLFKHNGVVKEFSSNEEVVNEIASLFDLDENQRKITLSRIYRKENRIVKSPLWHRLLYRAADSLAKRKLVTNPSTTYQITNKKEWMLTELGYIKVLKILEIPIGYKDDLPIISFEVQKIAKELKELPRPVAYNPIDKEKKIMTVTKEMKLRSRGFRQAIIEAYDFKCSVCGLKIISPNYQWEVEAAHIVPHKSNGKDDIWNGLALCHLHHWAFDVGMFSLLDSFEIITSKYLDTVPEYMGKMGNFDFLYETFSPKKISLPENENLFPHKDSLKWHRNNILSH